jgi:hypothetical protein
VQLLLELEVLPDPRAALLPAAHHHLELLVERLVSAGELVDPEAGVVLFHTPANRICQFRKSYLY